MKIVLISCSAKKQKHCSPAKDMYISRLFKGAYKYAKKLNADKIFILSAKRKLLEETDWIKPYDESLIKKSKGERQNWAKDIFNSLIEKGVDLQSDKFVFLAGVKYREFIIEYINNEHVKHKANICIPLKGLRIGEQLAFYNKEKCNE